MDQQKDGEVEGRRSRDDGDQGEGAVVTRIWASRLAGLRFGWMTRWRRLVSDYEQRLDVSEAFIHVAMGSLLLRRIAN